jgi:hypothetical protein
VNPIVKERWVKALKSNKYRKGSGRLRILSYLKGEQDLFCVIGVLCDLYAQVGPEKWQLSLSAGGYSFDGMSENLPDAVAKWADLPKIPMVRIKRNINKRKVPLALLNDEEELSFEELADLIEEQL